MAIPAMRQAAMAFRLAGASRTALQQSLKLQTPLLSAGEGDSRGWKVNGGTAASSSLLGLFAGVAAFSHSAALADAQASPAPASVSDPYLRPTDLKGLPTDITLYQYEVCPFCCKVKAVLDFHKIPYKVIEVNPLTKSELKWSKYKKVPVLQMDEEVVVDSTLIVSRLAAEIEGSKEKTISRCKKGVSVEEEAKWRKWADERFVKLMTANIYRSWDESWDTFKYITEKTNWSWGTRELARISGAVIMWQVGKKMPAKYGVVGDLREALYASADEFVDAIGPNRDFLGGDVPNLADLAVFGFLRAIEKAPTFSDLMANSRIADWYKKMEVVAGSSARTSTEGSEWRIKT